MSKKNVIPSDNFVAAERPSITRGTRRPTLHDDLSEYNSGHPHTNNVIDTLHLRQERDVQDSEVQRQLNFLRMEAQRQQRETDVALDKLNRLQNEISVKQHQIDDDNQKFF